MPDLTPEEFTKAQEAEYGTYVAVEAISIGGARAFNVGDAVPKSHVDNGVVTEEQVARRSSKAGKAVATGPQEG